MIIKVDRFISDSETTISKVYIDGEFECYALEDEYREEKVMGETRIPEGSYAIGIRDIGGFHARYSRRFKNSRDLEHKGMLQILNVPNFEYILIHIGNDEDDTAGCLLLGKHANLKTMTITRSKDAYVDFYNKVIDAALEDDLGIIIEDLDR